MELNLTSALLAIVVFQLFLIAFFLYSNRKGKRQSNFLLGTFFLMVAISMLDMWLSVHAMYIHYARIAFLDDGFVLALGPIIILYARTIMYKDYTLNWRSLVHFIPFFVVTVFFLIISIIPSTEEQKELIENVQNFRLPLILSLIASSFYIHPLVYLLKSFREVKRYGELIHEEYSSTGKMNIDWLYFTLRSLGILILLAIVYAIIPYSSSRSFAPLASLIFIGYIFYFANRVILKGLMQPDLFLGISNTIAEKYSASNLTSEERSSYTERLSLIMKKGKPYLDPELTINQLAKIVEITPKTLSQVINQSYKKSFFDFINTYRLEEAKEIFDNSTDEKLTIQEVMYQSGFNSKSSFNTFFKKVTGMTPSEYKYQKQ